MIFRTIIQERTFLNAAIKLHYAQSIITNQVQRLEKELGIKLFERGWDAELTPAGKIFAEEVDELIKHWNFATSQESLYIFYKKVIFRNFEGRNFTRKVIVN